jgi:diguanylate cyclase (GGDEF)-like protein
MTEPLSVVLIGLPEALAGDLGRDDELSVRREDDVTALGTEVDDDAVVVALTSPGPLETLRAIRAAAPDVAVIVVTDAAHAADGSIALHAGADDHLLQDATLDVVLPRAIRYATSLRALRRELATVDESTSLLNLRGLAPIAEHHLRLADRLETPVVFVFIRLDDHEPRRRQQGLEPAEELARDAAGVVLEAVRDADVPARIAPDTFCVLLSGDAEGAETLVLSRLVEAIAVHDARSDHPRSLALSVGTARYEPGSGVRLAEILEGAVRGLAARTTS